MKSRRLSSVAVRPLTETNRRSCTLEQPTASGLRQRRLDDVPAVDDARVTAPNCPREPGSPRRRGRQTQGAVSPGYFAYLRSAPRWVYPDGVHRISVPSARLPGLSRSPCDPLNFREVIGVPSRAPTLLVGPDMGWGLVTTVALNPARRSKLSARHVVRSAGSFV
jgi:hypothetical protein